MGNFRVGDKVICINDDWGGKNLIYPAVSDIYEITFPKQGRVYTVYSTKSIKNSPVISISELNFDIREVSRIHGRNFKGPWFMSYRFIKWDVIESDEKYSKVNEIKISVTKNLIFKKNETVFTKFNFIYLECLILDTFLCLLIAFKEK